MALYPDPITDHDRLLWCCLECGEYNRQRLHSSKREILLAGGILEVSVVDVATYILDDDHALEREITEWAQAVL